MAKIILTSRYLKASQKNKRAYLIGYIATRDGVDLRANLKSNEAPATQNQLAVIENLIETIPDVVGLHEYENFVNNPTAFFASVFLSAAMDHNLELIMDRENFVDYVAKRPLVEKVEIHGLFSMSDEPIDLKRVKKDVLEHEGNLYTHVISLRREDASRLGYESAEAWKNLIRSKASALSEHMKIPVKNLRWYAAFHNESHHPHAHLLVYNSEPRNEYLTEKGIEKLRSTFANEIFSDELYHLYSEKSLIRDEIKSFSKNRIMEIVEEIENDTFKNHELEKVIVELGKRLDKTKNNNVYGRLKSDVKALVDFIAAEISKDERIMELFEMWCNLQNEIVGTYQNKKETFPPLYEQKEFRSIKNTIIKTALAMVEPKEVDFELGTVVAFEMNFLDNVDIPPSRWVDNFESESVKCDNENSCDFKIEWSKNYLLARNYYLGKLISTNKEFENNIDEGLKWLLKASALEYVPSYIELGKYFMNARDIENSITWFQKAELYENPLANYYLGKIFMDSDSGFADYFKAETNLIKALEINCEDKSFIHFSLGKLYLLDSEIGNVEKAVYHFEQSAKNPDLMPISTYKLGKVFLEKGVRFDIEKALYWFQKSAECGNQFAEYQLGKIYLLGNEVEKNEELGRYYLSLSAGRGNVYARRLLDFKPDVQFGSLVSMILRSTGKMLGEETVQNYLKAQVDRRRRRVVIEKKRALGLIHSATDQELQS